MISASAVNELRQKTGAGMMDCKKALTECGGDFEAASEWLRKKGLAAAAKKADRVAAEGVVAADVNGTVGAVIELNSETDFVAKNDKFQELANGLIKNYMSYSGSDIEGFKSSQFAGAGHSVSDEISQCIGTIGENMSLRRGHKITVSQGSVVSYIHNAIVPGLGKIAVLVGFETNIDSAKVQALGKQIAMHIAAAKPESLNVASLDQELVAKEKAFIRDQALASGKPENVVEKMMEGRIAKFYEQVVLLEQTFVVDGETKISVLLENFGKENGGSISIKEFVRFGLGEGIEKKETNLADEVAATLKA